MALQILFQYQSTDSTAYLNKRLARLIGPGIYYGGTLSYSAGASSVQRSPVLAVGYDGVTVVDESSSTVAFTAAGTYYVVIRAKYNTGGSPATPTISEESMTAAQYAADADQNYLIIVGTVTTIAGGVISSISYVDRDVVDALGRDTVRGVVASSAVLPTPSPNTNRQGDCYFCISEQGWYYWTGSAWAAAQAAGSASLQSAYTDTGSGAGRRVAVDYQAILAVQSNASQRAKDIANAAIRIDKTGSGIAGGDIGVDVKVDGDRDFSSFLARSRYTNGTNVQGNEAVTLNAGANTLTFTRPTAMSTADANHCHLIEITDTASNQDGVYFFVSSGVAAGAAYNFDGTSPVFAADTGTANFYTIRFSIGSFVNNCAMFSVHPGMVTYSGDYDASTDCAHLHLVQYGGLFTQSYIKRVVEIDSGDLLRSDYYFNGLYQMQIGSIQPKNYMNDSGGAFFQSGSEVEKWIWPTWECSPSDASNNWLFSNKTGADPDPAATEFGVWECSLNTPVMFLTTSDWPEGMTLKGLEFDVDVDSSANYLRIYMGRQRWQGSGSTRLLYNLFSSAYQVAGGTGRRTDVYTPTHNYGVGASGITTPWTHGGSVTTQASDKLVVALYSHLANDKYVYGIRIKVRYRAINKWDGPPIT